MEGDEDDGEHDSRIFVNITAPHTIHCVGRIEDVGAHLRLVRVVGVDAGHHGQVVVVGAGVGGEVSGVVSVQVHHVVVVSLLLLL